MARGHRRKCKCCRELFHPNPRNLPYQRYCSKPRCRAASKTASHARWLAKPENRDYFHDPWHAERVRAWRAHNPGYWRKVRRPPPPLQDASTAQAVDSAIKTANRGASPLQEAITAQPAVLIGLIAHLVGTPVQEEIVQATDRLLRLGQDILAMSQGPPTPPP
jgi:hypothetical protein